MLWHGGRRLSGGDGVKLVASICIPTFTSMVLVASPVRAQTTDDTSIPQFKIVEECQFAIENSEYVRNSHLNSASLQFMVNECTDKQRREYEIIRTIWMSLSYKSRIFCRRQGNELSQKYSQILSCVNMRSMKERMSASNPERRN